MCKKYLNMHLKSVCTSADIRQMLNVSVQNNPSFLPILTSEFTGDKDNNNKAALSPMSEFMNICVHACVRHAGGL